MVVALRPARSRRNFTIGLFLGVAAMLGWQYWRAAQKNSTAGMPGDEAAFVAVLMQARESWIDAPNDLARHGMRAARAAALCKADPTLSANDWVGYLASVVPDAFPDYAGKPTARIIISLTSNVSLSTPSAPLLNSPSTMIEAGRKIYTAAAALRIGQKIRFSGHFPPGADCAEEESFSLQGGMTAPRLEIILTKLAAG